jgi:hypothetical protein
VIEEAANTRVPNRNIMPKIKYVEVIKYFRNNWTDIPASPTN